MLLYILLVVGLDLDECRDIEDLYIFIVMYVGMPLEEEAGLWKTV